MIRIDCLVHGRVRPILHHRVLLDHAKAPDVRLLSILVNSVVLYDSTKVTFFVLVLRLEVVALCVLTLSLSLLVGLTRFAVNVFVVVTRTLRAFVLFDCEVTLVITRVWGAIGVTVLELL